MNRSRAALNAIASGIVQFPEVREYAISRRLERSPQLRGTVGQMICIGIRQHRDGRMTDGVSIAEAILEADPRRESQVVQCLVEILEDNVDARSAIAAICQLLDSN